MISSNAARIAVVLLSTLSPLQAFADGAGLCGSEPEKYICGYLTPSSDFERTQAQARSAFSKLRTQISMKGYARANANCGFKPDACQGPCDPVLDSLEERYSRAFENSDSKSLRSCVMTSMQSVVMDELRAHSITMTQIQQEFSKFLESEIELATDSRAFSDSELAEITSEIRSVRLISADTYSQAAPYLKGSTSPYAYGCLPKLSPTAYTMYGFADTKAVAWKETPQSTQTTEYLPLSKGPNSYLVACPGMFLELLNTTSKDPFDNWARIVGHELGHNFHAFLKRSSYIDRAAGYDAHLMNFDPNFRLQEQSTLWPQYSTMLSCLQDSYSPAPSRTDARDVIQGSYPDQTWEKKFLPFTGHVASDLELHMIEYSAEYWGMQAVARRVLQKPVSERSLAAYNAAKLLCPGPGMQQYMTTDVDGTHPSIAFRIRMAFRNPELRQALGCDSDTAPYGGPFCGMSR